jgi:ribosomal protein L22
MMRYGSIYIVTNTVTGEQYVGQTRQKAAAEFLGVLKTSVANAIKQKGRVAGKYTLEKVA